MNPKVKRIRERCGSIAAFARMCAVTERMIWYWIEGKRTSAPIAAAFNKLTKAA